MNKCCKNCDYFHPLKHNFEIGKGLQRSHCCDVLLHLEPGEDSFVIEVSERDECEMYKGKNHE